MNDIRENTAKENAGTRANVHERIELVKTVEGHRAVIFGISKQVWEGQDYIPVMWDRWLDEGGFHTILLDGRIIGCIKATDHAGGQVTLEGLRIHPGWRERGCASAAYAKFLPLIERRRPCPRILRFATADANTISHHLGEKHDFIHATDFYYRFMKPGEAQERQHETPPGETREEAEESEYVTANGCAAQCPTPATGGNTANKMDMVNLDIRTPEPGDADAIFSYIRGTREWAPSGGLFPFGWVFYELTPTVVREEIERSAGEGLCQVARRRHTGDITGVLLAHRSERNPGNRDISWLSGNDDGIMADILAGFVKNAMISGAVELRGKTPSGETAGLMERCGFSRHDNFDCTVVFEKIL